MVRVARSRPGRSRSAGSPETTEAASTGSVGDRHAPSSAASARGRPSHQAAAPTTRAASRHHDDEEQDRRPDDLRERGGREPQGGGHHRPREQQARPLEQQRLEDGVLDAHQPEQGRSDDDARGQGEHRLADRQLPHPPADEGEGDGEQTDHQVHQVEVGGPRGHDGPGERHRPTYDTAAVSRVRTPPRRTRRRGGRGASATSAGPPRGAAAHARGRSCAVGRRRRATRRGRPPRRRRPRPREARTGPAPGWRRPGRARRPRRW